MKDQSNQLFRLAIEGSIPKCPNCGLFQTLENTQRKKLQRLLNLLSQYHLCVLGS